MGDIKIKDRAALGQAEFTGFPEAGGCKKETDVDACNTYIQTVKKWWGDNQATLSTYVEGDINTVQACIKPTPETLGGKVRPWNDVVLQKVKASLSGCKTALLAVQDGPQNHEPIHTPPIVDIAPYTAPTLEPVPDITVETLRDLFWGEILNLLGGAAARSPRVVGIGYEDAVKNLQKYVAEQFAVVGMFSEVSSVAGGRSAAELARELNALPPTYGEWVAEARKRVKTWDDSNWRNAAELRSKIDEVSTSADQDFQRHYKNLISMVAQKRVDAGQDKKNVEQDKRDDVQKAQTDSLTEATGLVVQLPPTWKDEKDSVYNIKKFNDWFTAQAARSDMTIDKLLEDIRKSDGEDAKTPASEAALKARLEEIKIDIGGMDKEKAKKAKEDFKDLRKEAVNWAGGPRASSEGSWLTRYRGIKGKGNYAFVTIAEYNITYPFILEDYLELRLGAAGGAYKSSQLLMEAHGDAYNSEEKVPSGLSLMNLYGALACKWAKGGEVGVGGGYNDDDVLANTIAGSYGPGNWLGFYNYPLFYPTGWGLVVSAKHTFDLTSEVEVIGEDGKKEIKKRSAHITLFGRGAYHKEVNEPNLATGDTSAEKTGVHNIIVGIEGGGDVTAGGGHEVSGVLFVQKGGGAVLNPDKDASKAEADASITIVGVGAKYDGSGGGTTLGGGASVLIEHTVDQSEPQPADEFSDEKSGTTVVRGSIEVPIPITGGEKPVVVVPRLAGGYFKGITNLDLLTTDTSPSSGTAPTRSKKTIFSAVASIVVKNIPAPFIGTIDLGLSAALIDVTRDSNADGPAQEKSGKGWGLDIIGHF